MPQTWGKVMALGEFSLNLAESKCRSPFYCESLELGRARSRNKVLCIQAGKHPRLEIKT